MIKGDGRVKKMMERACNSSTPVSPSPSFSQFCTKADRGSCMRSSTHASLAWYAVWEKGKRIMEGAGGNARAQKAWEGWSLPGGGFPVRSAKLTASRNFS